MKAVTADAMRRIDRITIDEIGIPGEVLMGLAGKAVADCVCEHHPGAGCVAVFCGTGNNGGDGFVAAYLLSQRGFKTDVYIAGEAAKASATSAVYLKACRACGIPVVELGSSIRPASIDFSRYDLILDALLGTGFTGKARGVIAECIGAINASGVEILSIDLPSGLPTDGEAPEGDVICANRTVTIGLPKLSLVTHPGREYTGALQVADIGFPASLTESGELHDELVDASYAGRRLAGERPVDAHKGSVGQILFIGGFDGMEGAIMLSVMAAMETGVGLAELLTTDGARSVIAGKIPELITRSLSLREGIAEKSIRTEIRTALARFFDDGRRYDALVIGPGMGRGIVAAELFRLIIEGLPDSDIKRVLIDGDGLFHLGEYLKVKPLPAGLSYVITPHFHEAHRLLGISVGELKRNRMKGARELAASCGTVALLKGPASIASDGVRSLINTAGNQALATAGSGDVLSGIIGALLLRDITPLEAAGIGAFLHGYSADLCVEGSGVGVLKAGDIIDFIRPSMNRIISG